MKEKTMPLNLASNTLIWNRRHTPNISCRVRYESDVGELKHTSTQPCHPPSVTVVVRRDRQPAMSALELPVVLPAIRSFTALHHTT